MKKEDVKEGKVIYIRSNKYNQKDTIIQATVNDVFKRSLRDGKHIYCDIHLDKYVDKNGKELKDGIVRYSLNYDISIDINEVYATPMEIIDAIKAEYQAEYDAIASEIKTLKELLEFPLKNGNYFSCEDGPADELVVQVYKDKAKELTGLELEDD